MSTLWKTSLSVKLVASWVLSLSLRTFHMAKFKESHYGQMCHCELVGNRNIWAKEFILSAFFGPGDGRGTVALCGEGHVGWALGLRGQRLCATLAGDLSDRGSRKRVWAFNWKQGPQNEDKLLAFEEVWSCYSFPNLCQGEKPSVLLGRPLRHFVCLGCFLEYFETGEDFKELWFLSFELYNLAIIYDDFLSPSP